MGLIIVIVIVLIVLTIMGGLAGLLIDSDEGRAVLFLGIVALLAWLGSKLLSLLIYITYGAILLMLLLIGVVAYKALFK